MECGRNATLNEEIAALEQHPDFETDPVLRLDRSDLVRRERDHRGPWLRFLALSYRMQLDRVEDLPIAPRDIRFEEVMPQDAMRREAAMWSTRLKSQTLRSNPEPSRRIRSCHHRHCFVCVA